MAKHRTSLILILVFGLTVATLYIAQKREGTNIGRGSHSITGEDSAKGDLIEEDRGMDSTNVSDQMATRQDVSSSLLGQLTGTGVSVKERELLALELTRRGNAQSVQAIIDAADSIKDDPTYVSKLYDTALLLKNSESVPVLVRELDLMKEPQERYNSFVVTIASIASKEQIGKLYDRILGENERIDYVSKSILLKTDPTKLIPFILSDDLGMDSAADRFFVAISTLTRDGGVDSVAALNNTYDRVTGERAEQVRDAIFNVSNKAALSVLEEIAIRGKDTGIRESAIYAFGNFNRSTALPYLVRMSTNEGMRDMGKQVSSMIRLVEKRGD